MKKEVISHLKGDIKNFRKEAKEDKELISKLKGKKMKKQSLKDKMDESLGMRRGKESTKKQSYKSRRDESMGMKKAMKKPAKKRGARCK